jgi:ethanolamine utilization protein EutA (predicted chaperonin)
MKWYGTLCVNKQNSVRGVPRFEVVQKESRWQNRLFFLHRFFLGDKADLKKGRSEILIEGTSQNIITERSEEKKLFV